MRWLSLICALLMLMNLTACFFTREYLTREEIFRLVEKNEELLLDCVRSGDFSDAEALDARITATEGKAYVDFYCGGRGLSVSGCDYGFYYSKNDLPLACHSWVNSDDDLQLQGDGWYKQETNGGDRYYTERIIACFYYYESTF